MTDRLGVMKAVWFLLLKLGTRPSRRTMQDMLGKTTGKKWATDEVHAFLAAWQYRGEDGRFYLREELGPVQVQFRSSSGPVTGPEVVLKTSVLGPVETSTQVQSRSPRADLQPESLKEKDIPPETNVSVPPAPEKPKAVKIVDDVPEVSFEPDDEVRMNGLVLERNPSGKIDPHVLRRFRAECKAKLLLVGAPCWRYGVDTALAKPAGWAYAVAVMRDNPLGAPWPPIRPASRGAPADRYVPKNLQPNQKTLDALDQLGRRNAVLPGI